jgi:hypothetical protein
MGAHRPEWDLAYNSVIGHGPKDAWYASWQQSSDYEWLNNYCLKYSSSGSHAGAGTAAENVDGAGVLIMRIERDEGDQ